MFDDVSGMMRAGIRHLQSRAKKILEELSPYIQEILHRDVIVKHSGMHLRKEEREVHISREWPLLSPGERSILLIILSILFIKLETKPCILLIDELETHLHPEAQVKLYKLLRQTLDNTRIDCCTCIASHSVFLLPLFEIQELVYINNGTIEKLNGGLYQQIYDDLVGEADKKDESLSDFLYSMSAWQFASYLAQCFLIPTMVDEAKSDDEQTLQFLEILKELYDRTKTIEVLDFGAGNVRIGKCIELMLTDNIEVQNLIVGLKYHVYDKEGISDKFQSNSAWRGGAYHTKEEINSSRQKFHLVLLYNVLHEIGVDEWVEELSFIMDSLTAEGYLIFGEREILSVGEKPYGKSGYLVLGKEELLKLFPKSRIEEIILPEREKTVTVCFAVKKPDTKDGYPNTETVKAALHLLKKNTKDKIRNRNINGLGKKGHSRKYAFYCQQYVNVEEAIEIMDNLEKETKTV